jgi:hypothetical protein
MDAWLAHLGAITRTRPTTRVVVGNRAEPIHGPSFATHLDEALSQSDIRKMAPAPTAAWGELYCREAGLLLGAPTSVPVLDEDDGQQANQRRVDPTQAA